ncbi:MAG TPA: type II secretion system protein GspE [Spirochaetes bacterium]|nr:type II secretion system protein GspE [Spirochaetota bacterium]
MKTVQGKKSKLLGGILVERNVVTREKLQEILLIQQDSPLRLGQLLVKKGLATEDDVFSALSEQFGIPYERRLEFSDAEGLFSRLPVHFLKKNRMVPYRADRKHIHVAVADALNIKPFDDLKLLYPGRSFQPALSTETEIQRVINAHFDIMRSEDRENVIEGLEESDLEILSSPVMETEDILDMANEAPIIKLVNMVISQAVGDRASDIHIEPYEKDLIVRYRIDGILYEMYTPPKKFQNAVISRIKIMANLNIAENRLPQDGRIQIKIGGKDIDIRVSVFPTYYGERVVLRLLNKTDMRFDLSSLGFSEHVLETFQKQIQKTYGVVLVTGPTGSGKSTTLYSVLSAIKSADINILTVEDPIEYQLQGIGQMQVKPKIDLTFASGLRSILRQDPDVIMIGEIRDLETAEIAVQAALTGHRVFSTLHTNDAASGITRLIDMGIEPFLITSSVNAFLAQRLVRTICPHCKKSYKPAPKMLAELGPSAKKIQKLYHGEGCEKCLNTGYLGRTGIYELLPMSDAIRKMIVSRSEAYEIKKTAIDEGMKTLFQDGLEKAVEGVTTVEEVLRVSG